MGQNKNENEHFPSPGPEGPDPGPIPLPDVEPKPPQMRAVPPTPERAALARSAAHRCWRIVTSPSQSQTRRFAEREVIEPIAGAARIVTSLQRGSLAKRSAPQRVPTRVHRRHDPRAFFQPGQGDPAKAQRSQRCKPL